MYFLQGVILKIKFLNKPTSKVLTHSEISDHLTVAIEIHKLKLYVN